MVNWLLHADTWLLLAINGFHAPWADVLMWWLSSKLIWIPLYLFLMVLLWNEFGHQIWRSLLLVLILVVLTDQGSVLIKNGVQRPRPTHNTEIENEVHVVKDYRGGTYGFISSHAANTTGIALFVGLLLRRRNKSLLPALIVWALVVSYSRIYLGVHYPGDVLAGALLGALFGWALAKLHAHWLPRDVRFRLRRT
ncbi:MAG: phosphatase PAP2 family protein [Bacteroidetes bacterium HGW-Bacteroidetes-22]|nr:MAG: phosphatase PAP2 family protein [Bacteroidetes bacterium HGW-Bacteroidetes-22]